MVIVNPAIEHTTVAYIFLLGAMILMLSGILFTLFASTSKPKYKPHVEFDDLAPGLNIDLGFYLTTDQYYPGGKRKGRKREESTLLLIK